MQNLQKSPQWAMRRPIPPLHASCTELRAAKAGETHILCGFARMGSR
ncbi:MAG: hypothetical protein NZM43_12090 [Saprospiraceae bacterium]|nr:hypothetical protein [Saprospiraceae bacterium]MDW8485051.1 hypothetical protein [Saprospiraceae bacterium]